MDLVNATPLSADVNISATDDDAPRYCWVTAKATFNFDTKGRISLETQEPVPIFDKDEDTDMGILPSDALPIVQGTYSVIALAAAYARRPTKSRRVALQVGRERRELQITGERVWVSDTHFSDPVPFTRMPISYGRAFGGSAEVFIDAESPLELIEQLNPRGKGFDPRPQMESLESQLELAPGYPVVSPNYKRQLPNVEAVDALIQRSSDAPFPAGWSTVEAGSPLHMVRLLVSSQDEESETPPKIPREVLLRCHPTWLIAPPSPGSHVLLEGLTPEERVRFPLPELDVTVDYVLGDYTGSRTLQPYMFVLLAEQRRFYVTYRFEFEYVVKPSDERGLRLRYAMR